MKTRIKFIIISLFFIGSAVLAYIAFGANQNKPLISEEFIQALDAVKPEPFLQADVPVPEKWHDFLEQPELGKQSPDYHEKRKVFAERATAFEAIGGAMCENLMSAYHNMHDEPLKGELAFKFDEALIKTIEDRGGYVIPLRLIMADIDAKYYNPEYVRNEDPLGGDRWGGNGAFHEKYATDESIPKIFRDVGFGYESGGFVTIAKRGPTPTYAAAYAFLRDYLTSNSRFEEVSQNLHFDYARGFIIPIIYDLDAAQEELVLMYVDFPYTLNKRQKNEAYELTIKPFEENLSYYKTECQVISKSQLVEQGLRHDQRFLSEQRAFATVNVYRPLELNFDTSRLSGTHIFTATTVPREVKVEQKNIVAPSLNCWLGVMGYTHIDLEKCTGENIALRYLDLLNQNICIGYAQAERYPDHVYPIDVYDRITKMNPSSYYNICQIKKTPPK